MFRWGFTKWDRCDYDQMKADGRIIVSILRTSSLDYNYLFIDRGL